MVSTTLQPAPTAGDTSWFVHDRFGLFIHWGIYALPARHEWVKNRERIRDEDYQRYFDHFYPDLYDPAEWARQARSAGMKYVVVTTKHHDGFCLSLIDWHHPELPIDGLHPMRDDLAFREAQKHRDIRTYAEYLHGQTRELLTQFGTIDIMWFDFSYADRDWSWSRGKGKDDWQSERLMAMVRELQPHIIVNDSMGI